MPPKKQSRFSSFGLNECAKRRISSAAGAFALMSFLLGAQPASAGFSISVQQVQPKVTVPAVGRPRLVLSKGMSLKVVVTSFALQYGWNVGWMAGDVFADEAESFSGMDHEEVLAAVLRRYKLIADRYPADKGYMIYSQASGEKERGSK